MQHFQLPAMSEQFHQELQGGLPSFPQWIPSLHDLHKEQVGGKKIISAEDGSKSVKI